MPRTTRSQGQQSHSQARYRASHPSQSQPAQSQVYEDDKDDDEMGDEEQQDDDAGHGDVHNELERRANDLVRLALFNETRRVPLKREEISKKVLGSNTRSFNLVFGRAQDILRRTFGMELVELQNRGGVDIEGGGTDKDAELLKNTGVKKRATPAGTKTYILRSTLDPRIVARACAPDAAICELEQADTYDEDEFDADTDEGPARRSTGAILAWHAADDVGAAGLLYVVLALILVDGRVSRDNDLKSHLKRLRLIGPHAQLPTSARTTHAAPTLDTFLQQLARQGFLERQRVGEAKGAGGKRGRGGPGGTQGGGNDEGAWEWRWGPRAFAEVGERPLARFVAELMARQGGEGEEDGEDGEEELDDRERTKRYEAVMKGVERAAAGGALLDVV